MALPAALITVSAKAASLSVSSGFPAVVRRKQTPACRPRTSNGTAITERVATWMPSRRHASRTWWYSGSAATSETRTGRPGGPGGQRGPDLRIPAQVHFEVAQRRIIVGRDHDAAIGVAAGQHDRAPRDVQHAGHAARQYVVDLVGAA